MIETSNRGETACGETLSFQAMTQTPALSKKLCVGNSHLKTFKGGTKLQTKVEKTYESVE